MQQLTTLYLACQNPWLWYPVRLVGHMLQSHQLHFVTVKIPCTCAFWKHSFEIVDSFWSWSPVYRRNAHCLPGCCGRFWATPSASSFGYLVAWPAQLLMSKHACPPVSHIFANGISILLLGIILLLLSYTPHPVHQQILSAPPPEKFFNLQVS